jgi:xanthine dehydrogenase YagR molybdenum-binding subunit
VAPRFGRVMNANLAEYQVPVNADATQLDVTFLSSEDRIFKPLGAKGLAEIALCGVAPRMPSRPGCFR